MYIVYCMFLPWKSADSLYVFGQLHVLGVSIQYQELIRIDASNFRSDMFSANDVREKSHHPQPSWEVPYLVLSRVRSPHN